MALCLEVAEHIEKKFSKVLVKNASLLSDVVMFTSAPPGQGGHFHLNEQPKEFWINLWNEADFELISDLTEKLKKEFHEKNILWWYNQNLLIFKRKS